MREPTRPAAFVPFHVINSEGALQPVADATFIVRTSSSNPLALASILRREIPHARPEFRVSNIRRQADLVLAQTVRERLLAMLALFFATVALLLAGIGLYGVLDYSVLQRRREIGIRMAIGASAGEIVRRVTADVFGMVLFGAVVGLAFGMASVRYIESLLYQVKATDLVMLVIPSFTILAAALLASLPAVICAVRIAPATTLRAEMKGWLEYRVFLVTNCKCTSRRWFKPRDRRRAPIAHPGSHRTGSRCRRSPQSIRLGATTARRESRHPGHCVARFAPCRRHFRLAPAQEEQGGLRRCHLCHSRSGDRLLHIGISLHRRFAAAPFADCKSRSSVRHVLPGLNGFRRRLQKASDMTVQISAVPPYARRGQASSGIDRGLLGRSHRSDLQLGPGDREGLPAIRLRLDVQLIWIAARPGKSVHRK